MRTNSVGFSEGVDPLPHEQWLFSGSRSKQLAPVPKDQLADNDMVRHRFISEARRTGAVSLCQLVEMASDPKKSRKWRDDDPCFLLELHFLKHFAEPRCIRHTGEMILAEMPGPEVEVSIGDAAAALRKLQMSPMLVDGQIGEAIFMVESVVTQLGLLANNEGPTMGENPSEFKVVLFEKFAWFFNWPVMVVVNGEEQKTMFRGKLGIQKCLHWLRHTFQHAPQDMHPGLLMPLSGFGFLMPADVQGEYKAWLVAATKRMERAADEDLDADFGLPVWPAEFEELFAPVAISPPPLQDTKVSPTKETPNTKKRRLAPVKAPSPAKNNASHSELAVTPVKGAASASSLQSVFSSAQLAAMEGL